MSKENIASTHKAKIAEKGSTTINVGILTISDRCFRNEAQDLSGPGLKQLIESGNLFHGQVLFEKCCPDEKVMIQQTILDWTNSSTIDLIVCTGGTGVAPRDVTPEAIKEIIEKEVIGLSMKMITESLKITPMAMLSRPICGIKGKTLILCLPGSRKASQECLSFVGSAITHAIELLTDNKSFVEKTHEHVQKLPTLNQGCGCSFKNPGDAETDEIVHSNIDVSKVAQRARTSPYPLISVADALEIVLSNATSLPSKQINTGDSLEFVLAEDVRALVSVPPFPASIKDGYAVMSSDGAGRRIVIGLSFAGKEPGLEEVTSGFCMRINTGAPIPPGADSVVQVEDTRILKQTDDGTEELEIEILKAPSSRQDIRPKGCDILVGQFLYPSGMRIGPAELGVLASAGVTHVYVHNKPRVGILSTGNELQEPFSQPLKEGKIYDSNKVTLMSLLQQHGIASFNAGSALDSPDELLRAVRKALRQSDILVTTGGVSMGDRDILKPLLLSDLKATIHFAQVFMKPGKPTTFATCVFEGKLKLILALPGNPVSATVTTYLYLLPLCRKMSGMSDFHNRIIKAKLASEVRLDTRPEYHRVSLTWSSSEDLPLAQSTGNQLSSRLLSMASAQALLQLPPASLDRKCLPSGSIVNALLINL